MNRDELFAYLAALNSPQEGKNEIWLKHGNTTFYRIRYDKAEPAKADIRIWTPITRFEKSVFCTNFGIEESQFNDTWKRYCDDIKADKKRYGKEREDARNSGSKAKVEPPKRNEYLAYPTAVYDRFLVNPAIVEDYLIPVGWEDIEERCNKYDGGLLYHPHQPIGLPLTACVKRSDDITIEFDKMPIEEQMALLDQFTDVLGVPFFAKIHSGSKSIHAHLKVDRLLPWVKMQYLVRLAILAFGSDYHLESAHQPARIPGAIRKKDGNLNLQKTIEFTGCRMNQEALKDSLSTFILFRYDCEAPAEIPDDYWSALKRSMDLGTHGELLAKGLEGWRAEVQAANEERLKKVEAKKKEYSGSGSGSKYHGAAWGAIREARTFATSVFSELVFKGRGDKCSCPFHDSRSGTAGELRTYDGEAHFQCQVCTENKPIDALQYTWMLQNGGNYQSMPSGNSEEWIYLYEDFCRSFCDRWIPSGYTNTKGYLVEYPKKPTGKVINIKQTGGVKTVAQERPEPEAKAGEQSKVVPIREEGTWKLPELRKAIEDLASEGLDEAELVGRLIELANLSGYTHHQVKELYQTADRVSPASEDRLRYLVEHQPSTELALPTHLIDPFQRFADVLAIPVDSIVFILMSICSSLTPDARLELRKETDHYIKPTIWSLAVGRSGAAKSPPMTRLLAPLEKLDAEENEERNHLLKAYRENLEYYEAKGKQKDDKKPSPPPLERMRVYKDFTIESVLQQLKTNNGKGLTIICHELTAWINSWGKYAGGSNDRAYWIQLYDGDPIVKTRVSTTKPDQENGLRVSRPIISLTAGIQPDVLQGILSKSTENSDGFWYRFVYHSIPKALRDHRIYVKPDRMMFDVAEMYNRLEALPPCTHKLSQGAQEAYWDFAQEVEQSLFNETNPLLDGIYTKHQTHALKLAMMLHNLRFVSGDVTNQGTIGVLEMTQAIGLAQQSLRTGLSILLEHGGEDEEVTTIAYKVMQSRKGLTIQRPTEIRHLGRKRGTSTTAPKSTCVAVLNMIEKCSRGAWLGTPGDSSFKVF